MIRMAQRVTRAVVVWIFASRRGRLATQRAGPTGKGTDMEHEAGPVPGSSPADSPSADQLIALIMSGTQPKAAEPEHRFSAAPSTVANSAHWVSPPMESELVQPRVEATFLRGAAQYTARSTTAPRMTASPTTAPTLDDAHAPSVSVAIPPTPPPVEPIVAPQPTPLVVVQSKREQRSLHTETKDEQRRGERARATATSRRCRRSRAALPATRCSRRRWSRTCGPAMPTCRTAIAQT